CTATTVDTLGTTEGTAEQSAAEKNVKTVEPDRRLPKKRKHEKNTDDLFHEHENAIETFWNDIANGLRNILTWERQIVNAVEEAPNYSYGPNSDQIDTCLCSEGANSWATLRGMTYSKTTLEISETPFSPKVKAFGQTNI
ncbi:unnamed protein product, partial [Nesidiocoris tenuis]